MIKNYLKIAVRFLFKNKTFSFINIIGLVIGTLSCLYILLYVMDQYSYDKYQKDAKNIYRITTSIDLSGDKHNNATCSPPIAPAMKRDFPEIEQFTRLVSDFGSTQHLIHYKEQSLYEKDAAFVDSTFFDVFTYHFTNGTPKDALTEPYSVVLLKNTADKLFGDENPVGKVININDENGKHDYKVTAVVDESLGKSHIHLNMFITMNSGGIGNYVRQNDSWAGNNFTNSYVKLYANADVIALQNKLPAFLNKYGAQQMKELGMKKKLNLQPIGSIHTTKGYEVENSKTVNPSFLYILILIAVLIQVIACINFMNLSTAHASERAKEVGVRKVVGARKADLIKQFISESFLLSFIGVLIAVPLMALFLPFLNEVSGANVSLTFLSDYKVWLSLAGIIIITGLIAGSYPAFYLSAFKTIKVIKGNFANHISAVGIRRSLVVFQFVLSVTLITGIIVIYSQLNFINNKDLGFDKNQKLIFSFYTNDAKQKVQAFSNDLLNLSEVKAVNSTTDYLGKMVPRDHGVYLAGGNMATAIDARNIITDENFTKANGIQLVSGRDLQVNDSGRVLINESLMNRLGLNPETAPGTRLYTKYEPNPATFVEVAGVMKDFNYNSLHEEVKPLEVVYNPKDGNLSYLIVSVQSKNYKSLLEKIQTVWHNNFSNVPFEYNFLNEVVQKQYETEITLSRIINLFTAMAILISCLGLFGLVAFSAEQRRKEIGVRKVLGASVSVIVQLLSKDFLKLILIAILIAVPIAWWAMNKWLQGFVYRINISWWMFILAGFIVMVITLITVSFQAIKAAIANPVKSLRTE